METWATISLVLGTNIIVSAFSYFIAHIQVNSSNKRFERQFQRDAELYKREQRRAVRSEPLLDLRFELSMMANKIEQINLNYDYKNTRLEITQEQALKYLEEAIKDWNEYASAGTFRRAIFALDNKELIQKSTELYLRYIEDVFNAKRWEELNPEELEQTRVVHGENHDRLAEIQSLINKLLEEL